MTSFLWYFEFLSQPATTAMHNERLWILFQRFLGKHGVNRFGYMSVKCTKCLVRLYLKHIYLLKFTINVCELSF